jgi:hypothetical protein
MLAGGGQAAVKGGCVLDGQVGENLILITLLGRVTAFGHHVGYEELRSRDSVGRRVDELLLDAHPPVRVACPGHIGERLEVKTLDPALAFGELGFRLAPAVALADQPVVFGTKTLLEPAAAGHCQHAENNCPDHDDGHDNAHDNPG